MTLLRIVDDEVARFRVAKVVIAEERLKYDRRDRLQVRGARRSDHEAEKTGNYRTHRKDEVAQEQEEARVLHSNLFASLGVRSSASGTNHIARSKPDGERERSERCEDEFSRKSRKRL